MTTISSNPYSYLSTLLNPNSASSSTSSTPSTSATNNALSEVDQLLGSGSSDGSSSLGNILDSLAGTSSGSGASTGLPQLSSSLISLLQAYQPGNAQNQEVGLLGGDGDSLTGGIESTILSSTYANDLTTAYSLASANGTSTGTTTTGTGSGSGSAAATTTDPVQTALSSYTSAINAYNTTLLQQAQTVLADNSLLTA